MDFFNYTRRKTAEIRIGKLTMGGESPIRVQTMANTDTNDIEASVDQAIRCCKAGTELLRYTTQGIKEATNLGEIHKILHSKGIDIPLVADIHFNPKVAETAAQYVEKIRINPGNFVPGKSGAYTQEEWDEELDKIREKLLPILDICRKKGTVIRIGVNHGSLSPRIMSRYGNTAQGLAASCIEFIELCEKENFKNIVLSVKASNTIVMIHAVRLLVKEMDEKGMHYPIHLGVTEAGSDDEGRIKSAVGIGTLLLDGIGDTIRVSLSESPESEIPVARKLVKYIDTLKSHTKIEASASDKYNPFSYTRKISSAVNNIGNGQVPVVIASSESNATPSADYIYGKNMPKHIKVDYASLNDDTIDILKQNPKFIVLLYSNHTNPVGELRATIHKLMNKDVSNPIIVERTYNENDLEYLQIKAATEFGALLTDGLIDGIYIKNEAGNITAEEITALSFNILQASRARISKTEYTSCPSCGRTKFDLPTAVKRVKEATQHLVGLKIAVMGCIVNGPGEMADADYGYIGAGMKKVSLYKGKTCVLKNINENEAIEKLLELIENDRKTVSNC